MDDHRLCNIEKQIAVLETQRDGAEKALTLVAHAFEVQLRALFALLILLATIAGIIWSRR
jgi:hypothetical protein